MPTKMRAVAESPHTLSRVRLSVEENVAVALCVTAVIFASVTVVAPL